MNSQLIFESMITATFLSILIERFLALFFEQKNIAIFLKDKNLKELIAFCLSFGICYAWQFDIVSLVFGVGPRFDIWNFGYFLTAGLISGGSKVSVKIFRDYLKVYKEQKNSAKDLT